MGIIAIIGIVIYGALFWVMQVNLKKIKEIAENEKLDQIADQYPENRIICEEMLKKVKNEQVMIEEDKEANTTMYLAIPNKIKIANLKGNYSRIQTIAHECLHSIQNRRLLIANVVISNVYLLFFIIVFVLSCIPQIQGKQILLCALTLLGLSYYMIRAYLENDAMIKARYLAKEYMEEKQSVTKEEIDSMIYQYDKLNDIGIRCVNFQLFGGIVIKVVLVALISWGVECFF